MKKELLKIAFDINTGKLKKRKARKLLLSLLGVGVSFSEGDNVLYVDTYLGTVQSDRTVLLTDGTVIGSLDSQPHKFRAVI